MAVSKDAPNYEQWKVNIAKARTGKPHPLSEKAKTHIRKLAKQRVISEETRLKMSKAKKGIIHSEETRRKLSEAHKGKILSDEHKKKLSESHKGQKPSLETLQKRSLALKGKLACNKGIPHTYSVRLKIVETMIGGFWYGNVQESRDSPQYCEKFNADLKERVRAFFGYRCVECGAPQNGKKLDVHHVWYNKKACCDDTPRSLVALCHKCHTKTTRGDRTYWSNHLQEIINTQYDGRCWLSREEMGAAQA
jgi:hypothetical protein